MSWINKIKNGITITTPDGERYSPQYMNASFVTEYQHTEFNFINISGSLVIRKKPIGVKYSLELHFQGADHLDTVQKFKSSIDNNEGELQIEHPLYDILLVQVTSLGFDDSALNRTKVTATVIETMSDAIFKIVTPDIFLNGLFDDTVTAAVAIKVPPSAAAINNMAATNKSSYNKGLKILQNPIDFDDYYNAFNTATTYINTATATPILAMESLTNVLTMPGKFQVSVLQRLQYFVEVYNGLRAGIVGLLSMSLKETFTSQASAIIAGMNITAANPLETDYKLNSEVFDAIDTISESYNQFIEDLDYLQAKNGGDPLGYVADPLITNNLSQLFNLTVSNLFNIALNARSERFVITDKDTNVVELTHRLYGLDNQDKNLDELISNNNLAIDEYLQIQKGRKIIYYH